MHYGRVYLRNNSAIVTFSLLNERERGGEKETLVLLETEASHPFETLHRKSEEVCRRFIDHRVRTVNGRDDIACSALIVSMISYRMHACAGVDSTRVEGRRSTVRLVHAIWPERAAVDRIACSSSLLKPAHAYCFYLICRWHDYLCGRATERERERKRVWRYSASLKILKPDNFQPIDLKF